MPKRNSLNKEEIFFSFSLILILLLVFSGFFQKNFNIFGIFLSQFFLILLPTLFLIFFFNLNFNILKLKKTNFRFYTGAISLWLLCFIGVLLYSIIQIFLFPSSLSSLEGLSTLLSKAKTYEIVLYLSLAPAICEEIFFRGFIYGNLEKITTNKNAIIISSLLFGIFHIYPAKIITTALLGISFSYIVYLSKSIYPAILMHFINNLFTIYLSKRQDLFIKPYFSWIFILMVLIAIKFYNNMKIYEKKGNK